MDCYVVAGNIDLRDRGLYLWDQAKVQETLMRALIVVDVQNDFCPGGALPVLGGDEIVDPINEAMVGFDAVILTQDWHPAGAFIICQWSLRGILFQN